MAYEKQGFYAGEPLKASQLEAMEDGIIEAYNLAANNGGNGEGGTGADGKSAYEIWLELGNIGSKQDFINSLKGEKGDQGEAGEMGPQGEQGLKGEDGKDGLTTAVKVGETVYTHNNGTIELPEFLTEHQSLEGYATEAYVDTAVDSVKEKFDGLNAKIAGTDDQINKLLSYHINYYNDITVETDGTYEYGWVSDEKLSDPSIIKINSADIITSYVYGSSWLPEEGYEVRSPQVFEINPDANGTFSVIVKANRYSYVDWVKDTEEGMVAAEKGEEGSYAMPSFDLPELLEENVPLTLDFGLNYDDNGCVDGHSNYKLCTYLRCSQIGWEPDIGESTGNCKVSLGFENPRLNLKNGQGEGSIQSSLATTPKLAFEKKPSKFITSEGETLTGDAVPYYSHGIYNPTSDEFDIACVDQSLMNPCAGAIVNEDNEGGQVAFGLGNTAQGRNNFIAGTRNYSNGNENTTFGQGNYNTGKYSLASGGNNILKGCQYALVHGSNNTLTNTNSNSSVVFGNKNIIDTLKNSLVVGQANNVTNLNYGIVVGRNNKVHTSTTETEIILGSYFNKNVDPSIILGSRNISIGSSNEIAVNDAVETNLFGNSLKACESRQTIIGNHNNCSDEDTNYSIIFANGINAENKNNIFALPTHKSTAPAKLNCGLNMQDYDLQAKNIQAASIKSGSLELTGNVQMLSSTFYGSTATFNTALTAQTSFNAPNFKVDSDGILVYATGKFKCASDANFNKGIQHLSTSTSTNKATFITQYFDTNSTHLGNTVADIKGADIRLYKSLTGTNGNTTKDAPAIKLSVDKDTGVGTVEATKFIEKGKDIADTYVTKEQLKALDYSASGGVLKTIVAISQTDGKISAEFSDIDTYSKSKIDGKDTDTLTKAKGYIDSEIDKLNFEEKTGLATQTITRISQTNGIINATYSNIAFPVTSVDGKTGDVVINKTATPTSESTACFTAGGAYTQFNTKLDKALNKSFNSDDVYYDDTRNQFFVSFQCDTNGNCSHTLSGATTVFGYLVRSLVAPKNGIITVSGINTSNPASTTGIKVKNAYGQEIDFTVNWNGMLGTYTFKLFAGAVC